MTIYDPGDIVVIGAAFRVDGTLTTPTALVATVTNPEGTELNSTTNPTSVDVNLATSAPTAQLDALGVTAAENITATGVCTVRFYVAIQSVSTANAAGLWLVRLQATGAAADTEFVYVHVRHPATSFTWTAGVTV